VIDLTLETPVPLAAAAKLVPPARTGKKTHLSTLLRWISRGCRGPAGALVRLEGIRIGNRWHTSREALQRFAEALTPPLKDAQASPAPRSPATRSRASERAETELKKLGV
jgi:hypothetical protein